jgi:hypothetical protein
VKHINIEVSPSNVNKLYVLIDYKYVADELWVYNISNNSWSFITNNINVYMGDGHGFGVSDIDESIVYVASGIGLYRINTNTHQVVICSIPHVDVEDVISVNNNIYIGTHGGICKSTDGVNFQYINNGLGVSHIYRLSTNRNSLSILVYRLSTNRNSLSILAGLYHDGTIYIDDNKNITTITNGDGQRPLFTNDDKIYITSAQNGIWLKSSNNIFSLLACAPFNCSSAWNTEGTFNFSASCLYRITGSWNNSQIIRSFDYGTSNQKISNFTSIGNNSYLVWKIYSPSHYPNYLYAHIIISSGQQITHQLWRTTNALDIVLNNIQWELLPLPVTTQWFSKIDFDENDPNIVYLISSSDAYGSNSPFGHNMVFKVNYTNPNLMFPGNVCPVGICQNISYNLPNTGVGDNAFTLEKGTNGGMYIGTDVGVFYTNNQLLANDPQPWKLHGTALPHVPINGLEINYVTNKIRAGLYGRGVWEADLYCPPDYDINIHSANYTQYNHQFNEAENNIYITTSGSSYVLNNFTARAGNEIVITPTANDEIILDGTGNGTHLFIHPCNHPGNSFRQSVTSKRSTDDYPVVPEMINGSMMKSISGLDEKHNHIAYLYPNPTDEHVHIDVKDNAIIEKILLKDISGKIVLQKESNTSSETIDISHLSDGLYFVVVQTTAGTYTEKLIVRHE